MCRDKNHPNHYRCTGVSNEARRARRAANKLYRDSLAETVEAAGHPELAAKVRRASYSSMASLTRAAGLHPTDIAGVSGRVPGMTRNHALSDDDAALIAELGAVAGTGAVLDPDTREVTAGPPEHPIDAAVGREAYLAGCGDVPADPAGAPIYDWDPAEMSGPALESAVEEMDARIADADADDRDALIAQRDAYRASMGDAVPAKGDAVPAKGTPDDIPAQWQRTERGYAPPMTDAAMEAHLRTRAADLYAEHGYDAEAMLTAELERTAAGMEADNRDGDRDDDIDHIRRAIAEVPYSVAEARDLETLQGCDPVPYRNKFGYEDELYEPREIVAEATDVAMNLGLHGTGDDTPGSITGSYTSAHVLRDADRVAKEAAYYDELKITPDTDASTLSTKLSTAAELDAKLSSYAYCADALTGGTAWRDGRVLEPHELATRAQAREAASDRLATALLNRSGATLGEVLASPDAPLAALHGVAPELVEAEVDRRAAGQTGQSQRHRIAGNIYGDGPGTIADIVAQDDNVAELMGTSDLEYHDHVGHVAAAYRAAEAMDREHADRVKHAGTMTITATTSSGEKVEVDEREVFEQVYARAWSDYRDALDKLKRGDHTQLDRIGVIASSMASGNAYYEAVDGLVEGDLVYVPAIDPNQQSLF